MEWERDYDRIVFSTPLRRMADKTQVFPLEKNDTVRTRLTHSYEVANLAKNIGLFLAYDLEVTRDIENVERTIPNVLAAAGLAHDLGNPPFGHQGENTIRQWFARNHELLDAEGMTEAMKRDFLSFDGNAQTFRLLTHTQRADGTGMDLTYATLGAALKYPLGAASSAGDCAYAGKLGYFTSEAEVAAEVFAETGVPNGQRHPLAWVIEACDDVAYSVLDIEDTTKKDLVSPRDLLSFLESHVKGDPVVSHIVERGRLDEERYRGRKLSPAELNDAVMQRVRVNSMAQMVNAVKDTLRDSYDSLMRGSWKEPLLARSKACHLVDAFKEFGLIHAYRNQDVLRLELDGHNALTILMDILWYGIDDRKDTKKLAGKRRTPLSQYIYGRISENYRTLAEDEQRQLPLRYRELQLLTDMVSGMTDSYAIELYDELQQTRSHCDWQLRTPNCRT
jgi:dGTPase